MAQEEARGTLLPEDVDLGKALDALNEEVGEVQDWLVEQGILVRAEVPLPSGGALAWGKLRGLSWTMIVVSVEGQEAALSTVSSARRLEAVAHVPALVAEARSRQVLMVSDVEAARERLRDLRYTKAGMPKVMWPGSSQPSTLVTLVFDDEKVSNTGRARMYVDGADLVLVYERRDGSGGLCRVVGGNRR